MSLSGIFLGEDTEKEGRWHEEKMSFKEIADIHFMRKKHELIVLKMQCWTGSLTDEIFEEVVR